MEYNDFLRKPFKVEAVEVTEDNIEEVSKLVGELLEKEDGTHFIQVDRRKVPNIYKVHPGFWLTRMESNGRTHIRCYSNHVFQEQFSEITPSLAELVGYLNVETDPEPAEVFPQEGSIQFGEDSVVVSTASPPAGMG